MVDFRHFEPREVAPGASVVILVSSRLGPRVAIPLHAFGLAASSAILDDFLNEQNAEAVLGAGPSLDSGGLVYLVGEDAYRQMMELEGIRATRDWPSNVLVIFLHGAPMTQD
jgi:hypothetical protein